MDILGRRFCSETLFGAEAALSEETLATSRDIWSWLALSCVMLILSSCAISVCFSRAPRGNRPEMMPSRR